MRVVNGVLFCDVIATCKDRESGVEEMSKRIARVKLHDIISWYSDVDINGDAMVVIILSNGCNIEVSCSLKEMDKIMVYSRMSFKCFQN